MIITIIFFRQMAHIFLVPFFRQIIIHFNIEFSSFFWRQNGSIFNDTHKSIDRCRLKKVSLILTFINFFPRMKIFLFKKLNNTSFFVRETHVTIQALIQTHWWCCLIFQTSQWTKTREKKFPFFGKTIQCLFQTGKKKNQLLGQNHLLIDFVKIRYNLGPDRLCLLSE